MAKAAPKKAAKRTTKAVNPAPRPAAAKKTKTKNSATLAKKPASIKAPVVSKDELRAQLEKAQNLIAALRTKGREAVREAKVSAAKIAELEAKVALLEKKSAAQEKSTNPVSAAAKPAKRRGRKVPVQADDDGPIKSPDQELTEAETPAD